MVRTADRPLATGTLRPAQVLAFAIVLGVASMAILLLWVNPITALLTFASLIGYAFVYTGFLKRATPQNIVIGGIAGAAPPLHVAFGCVADGARRLGTHAGIGGARSRGEMVCPRSVLGRRGVPGVPRPHTTEGGAGGSPPAPGPPSDPTGSPRPRC